jgi:sugar O-acyltransferase (sialic acid O-acetyltransferase NeuD family)
MIIIGAKGHAKEIFDIIIPNNNTEIFFYDNISSDIASSIRNKIIIKDIQTAKNKLTEDSNFILGLGGVKNRYNLYTLFVEIKGNPISAIAQNSFISPYCNLGKGLNIMPFSSINADVSIGDGTLINSHSSIHHDSIIGRFVEISPGVRILGNCTIGDFTTIGSNATILPKINVGSNVIVAAGAVVTKDIPDNCMVAGIPAIIKKELPPINF